MITTPLLFGSIVRILLLLPEKKVFDALHTNNMECSRTLKRGIFIQELAILRFSFIDSYFQNGGSEYITSSIILFPWAVGLAPQTSKVQRQKQMDETWRYLRIS
jgi:hypothetical protein